MYQPLEFDKQSVIVFVRRSLSILPRPTQPNQHMLKKNTQVLLYWGCFGFHCRVVVVVTLFDRANCHIANDVCAPDTKHGEKQRCVVYKYCVIRPEIAWCATFCAAHTSSLRITVNFALCTTTTTTTRVCYGFAPNCEQTVEIWVYVFLEWIGKKKVLINSLCNSKVIFFIEMRISVLVLGHWILCSSRTLLLNKYVCYDI